MKHKDTYVVLWKCGKEGRRGSTRGEAYVVQDGKVLVLIGTNIDESLDRPLTDSELAEECMGGMCVFSAQVQSFNLTKVGSVEAAQWQILSSLHFGAP